MGYLINPFQRHSLCFSSGSSLSRCVFKVPAKTLDYPGGWEGLSLGLTPALPYTGAEGPGPPSSCGLGLLPARQLVPPQPYGVHAHDTATTSSTQFKWFLLRIRLPNDTDFVVQFRSCTVTGYFFALAGKWKEQRGCHAGISQRSHPLTGNHANSSGTAHLQGFTHSPKDNL